MSNHMHTLISPPLGEAMLGKSPSIALIMPDMGVVDITLGSRAASRDDVCVVTELLTLWQ